MRLADFILANVEPILLEWEHFARSLTPGKELSVLALRDHAEDLLRVTARDMTSAQTAEQQSDKSKGWGGGGSESDRLDSASAEHALERVGAGFDLDEVISEYRALRASVLRLWRASAPEPHEHELTDLIRFNESIDQSLAQAVRSFTKRVEESRELFLATLGHDLRGPLNAIMLSSQILAFSEQLDEEKTQTARQMVTFGHVMNGMIADLLDFTRARLGGGMPISPAPVDLEALCHEVAGEFRASHPDRTVRVASAGGARGEWDPARLRQVVSNLVSNAIAHGEDGTPVDIAASEEGAHVVLTVANRGPAIPAAALPTIFDPFVRLAPAASHAGRGGDGIGLGLYIARQIVLAHRGTISVTSSEAEGTVVTVQIPRSVRPEPHRS